MTRTALDYDPIAPLRFGIPAQEHGIRAPLRRCGKLDIAGAGKRKDVEYMGSPAPGTGRRRWRAYGVCSSVSTI